eukprot:9123685-Alexandrium_andersonii.AAC.1
MRPRLNHRRQREAELRAPAEGEALGASSLRRHAPKSHARCGDVCAWQRPCDASACSASDRAR